MSTGLVSKKTSWLCGGIDILNKIEHVFPVAFQEAFSDHPFVGLILMYVCDVFSVLPYHTDSSVMVGTSVFLTVVSVALGLA